MFQAYNNYNRAGHANAYTTYYYCCDIFIVFYSMQILSCS